MISNDPTPGIFMTLTFNSSLRSASGTVALCLFALAPQVRGANTVVPAVSAPNASTVVTAPCATKANAAVPSASKVEVPATRGAESTSNKVQKTVLEVAEPGTLTSIEGFNVDQATPNSLAVAADYALKQGQVRKAIEFANKRSIKTLTTCISIKFMQRLWRKDCKASRRTTLLYITNASKNGCSFFAAMPVKSEGSALECWSQCWSLL